ncbi:hypothetical protein AAFF27_06480 [Xylophilus sp. GW821-FHT01B05]
MSNSDTPSAKQRLEASRQALLQQLRGPEKHRRGEPTGPGAPSDDAAAEHQTESSSASRPGTGLWSAARHGINAWWQFHPARAAGAVARPFLEDYAERKPLQLLGIAAGVGAVVALTRPWRLVSLGGLAIAALKSSQATSLALSLLTAGKDPTPKDPP